MAAATIRIDITSFVSDTNDYESLLGRVNSVRLTSISCKQRWSSRKSQKVEVTK